MRALFRQFSFPGGIPSHVAPGDARARSTRAASSATRSSHAYGAAFDNPDLLVACVVGDGEAETGPLATVWHCQQVPQPGQRRRGAADPAPQRLQDRQPDGAGPDPRRGAAQPAARLRLRPVSSSRAIDPDDDAVARSRWPRRWTTCARRDRARSRPRARAARRATVDRPRWPMIVLRTPKGWTGPARGRRQAGRGHLPRAPGAAVRGPRQPRAPARARGLAAVLPAGGAVRRRRAGSIPELRGAGPAGRRSG